MWFDDFLAQYGDYFMAFIFFMGIKAFGDDIK